MKKSLHQLHLIPSIDIVHHPSSTFFSPHTSLQVLIIALTPLPHPLVKAASFRLLPEIVTIATHKTWMIVMNNYDHNQRQDAKCHCNTTYDLKYNHWVESQSSYPRRRVATGYAGLVGCVWGCTGYLWTEKTLWVEIDESVAQRYIWRQFEGVCGLAR